VVFVAVNLDKSGLRPFLILPIQKSEPDQIGEITRIFGNFRGRDARACHSGAGRNPGERKSRRQQDID
jgi:hypothetical protein